MAGIAAAKAAIAAARRFAAAERSAPAAPRYVVMPNPSTLAATAWRMTNRSGTAEHRSVIDERHTRGRVLRLAQGQERPGIREAAGQGSRPIRPECPRQSWLGRRTQTASTPRDRIWRSRPGTLVRLEPGAMRQEEGKWRLGFHNLRLCALDGGSKLRVENPVS